MASADTPPDAPTKGRSPLVLVLIAVLAGTGGAAAAFTQADSLRAFVGGAPADAPDAADAPPPVEYGEFVEMAGVVVNPRGTDGRRYLMVKVGAEAEAAETLDRLTVLSPAATDAVIGLLARRSVAELADITRRDSLKEEVRVAFNDLLGEDGPVTRVYFTQYVLQ